MAKQFLEKVAKRFVTLRTVCIGKGVTVVPTGRGLIPTLSQRRLLSQLVICSAPFRVFTRVDIRMTFPHRFAKRFLYIIRTSVGGQLKHFVIVFEIHQPVVRS
jgi:hypothetical protein